MSERKGLQKYYPPDYDPRNVPKKKQNNKKVRTGQDGKKRQSVRMMAPFSFQCNSCGGFTMRNTKFNARKEVSNETYLGQRIVILYLRCPSCSGEICLKTDPKNADYAVVSGAKRNFTPWRDENVVNETDEQRLDRLDREQREQEEREERERLYGPRANQEGEEGPQDGEDPMKYLENKMADAKREMEMQDELHDLRVRNARINAATQDGLLDRVHTAVANDAENDAIDQEEAASAFQKDTNGNIVRRAAPLKKPERVQLGKVAKPALVKKNGKRANPLGIVKKKTVM